MESIFLSTVDNEPTLNCAPPVAPPFPVLWDHTLIEEIEEYLGGRFETNKDFRLNLGCILVGAAAGRFYFIMTKKGKLYLNLFTICVGGSGIAEKTLALKIIQKILEILGDMLGKSLLLPSKFTTEGMTFLLHHQQEEYGDVPEGVILSDEYTNMIRGSRSKDWMVNSLEYMSQLYSGLVEGNVTVSRGLESVPEVYVNFAGATTPYLITLTSEAFYIQGNGVRILFVLDDEREYHEPEVDDFKDFWTYQPDDEEKELEKIAGDLYEIRERVLGGDGVQEPIQVEFDADAMKILFNYREVVTRKAHAVLEEDLFDPRTNYLSRLAEFAFKKAALHAIARLYRSSGGIIVNRGDARFGVFEAQKAYRAFLRMRDLETQYRTGKTVAPQSTNVDREKILLCLKVRTYCSAKEIESFTGIKLRTVQRRLKVMSDEGLVEKTVPTRGAKWRVK